MNTVNFEDKYKFADEPDDALAAKYRAGFADVRPSEQLLAATAEKMRAASAPNYFKKLRARRCAAVAASICFVLLAAAAMPHFGLFGGDAPANEGSFSTASIYTAGVNADGTPAESGDTLVGGAVIGDVVMTPEAMSEDMMKYEGLTRSAANKETFANPSHTENVQVAENTENAGNAGNVENTENVEAYTGASMPTTDMSEKQSDEGVAVDEAVTAVTGAADLTETALYQAAAFAEFVPQTLPAGLTFSTANVSACEDGESVFASWSSGYDYFDFHIRPLGADYEAIEFADFNEEVFRSLCRESDDGAVYVNFWLKCGDKLLGYVAHYSDSTAIWAAITSAGIFHESAEPLAK